MKRLCLILILTIAVSCRETIFPRPDIIVQGKLTNSATEKIFLTSQDEFFKYSLPKIIDTVFIATDSSFKFYSESDRDVSANLNFRKYNYTLPIYLSKGDSVFLLLDLTNKKIESIGGEGYKKVFLKDSLYKISKSIRRFEQKMLSDSKTCNPILLESKQSIDLFLDEYFYEYKDRYIELKEELQRHFELLFDICSLKSFHADSTFERLIKKYNLKSSVFKNNKAFYHFANLMTDYMIGYVGLDTNRNGTEQYDRVVDSIMSKTDFTFRDICLVSLMEKIIPREWSYSDELYLLGKKKVITPEMHEESYRYYLNKLVEQHFKFQPGKKFPEFLLSDENTYQYNLYRFRGRTVLIMFRDALDKDLAELKQFHQSFEEREDIATISISLGSESQKLWSAMIRRFDIGGVNLYEPNGIYSELADKLMIRDLPMYFEIDEEGNIVSPGNLNLEELQKKLLAK